MGHLHAQLAEQSRVDEGWQWADAEGDEGHQVQLEEGVGRHEDERHFLLHQVSPGVAVLPRDLSAFHKLSATVHCVAG